tara:strand:- start:216 stop:827 length:612 start_codon:yes stop_codon:yes gene_type:complete
MTLITFNSFGQINYLVINEVMVSNDTALVDEYGEFDDWIEIYNNGNNSINLFGYHLSDDEAELEKYSFPSIDLNPDEYLIIWADDGYDEQGVFHANFKLSSAGESLFFTDPDLNIIDQVEWGPMEADIAYARVPNGVGEFMIQQHTFGANNEGPTSSLLSHNNNSKKIINTINILGQKTNNSVNIYLEIHQDYSVSKKAVLNY